MLEGIQDGSIFSGTLGALGENGQTTLSTANLASGDALVDKIGTPEARGSRVITAGPDAFNLWNAMASYGAGIEDMQLPYIAAAWPFSAQPTINSTSFIASVLHSIGVDITNFMPFGLRNSPGASTLIGTPENDNMQTTPNFNQIVTGGGEDTLRGSNNLIFVEKLYGGADNDTIYWSPGENIVHGGQPRLAYSGDGFDTVDYSGVGTVHIYATRHAVEHKVANYISVFEGGSDQLFSIESVAWDRANDHVIAGEGVELLEKPLLLDLKGNGSGRGDELGFTDGDEGVIFNAVNDTTISVQTIANMGEDAGYWAQSVEWLAGSNGDDLIYTNSSVRGAEGADGDDTLDARLAIPFSGQSPEGYDIELDGGNGNDILVSGGGRTLARGGDGRDTFVLSAMTSGSGTVEFVIVDAEAEDKLYVPYDFFLVARGDYEDSQLFQLTGAAFKIDDIIIESLFQWGLPDDDQIQGNIEFVGSITYKLEGSDLVLTLYQGHEEFFAEDFGPDEPPGPTVRLSANEGDTLTTIRVRDWSEGDLGLTFPLTWSPATFDQSPNGFADYPGYTNAINDDTDASHFMAALDERPEAHLPSEFATSTVAAARSLVAPVTDGTDGNDVLFTTGPGPFRLSGKGGDDDITGSDGGDILDGGTGGDTLRGGRGNDTYYVDAAADTVVELERAGFDRVISSIDYTLGDNVEHLALAGAAINGIGNALRNTIEGNDLDNILVTGDGDDTLAGNAGNDTLIGGAGGDGYVYENGDGRDIIIEDASPSLADDVLILAGTLSPGDVTFIRDPNAFADLILSFTDGGRVTIKNYFSGNGAGIESLEFTTGTTWSGSQLAALASAALISSNEAPIATDDDFTAASTGSVTIPFAALFDNDRDYDGDTLSLLAVSNAAGGTADIDGNGNVIVTAAAQTGDRFVSFDYTVGDGRGGSAQATVNLYVSSRSTPINQAPVAAPVTLAAIAEDSGSRLITSAQLLAGVTDADGPGLSITALSIASGLGSLVNNNNGSWSYTPALNDETSATFNYTASDGSLTASSTATLDITPVNDAPVARADNGFSVKKGKTLKIAPSDLIKNDSDIDGGQLVLTSVSNATGGTVTKNAHGDVVFKAARDFSGIASFSYEVSDGQGAASTAIVSINVLDNKHLNRIVGTPGRDTLSGTAGNDVFFGKGGSDTFVFLPALGHDQIRDFQTRNRCFGTDDVIDLRGNGITSYSQLWSLIHQDGADTVITLDSDTSITLSGVKIGTLHHDHFKII